MIVVIAVTIPDRPASAPKTGDFDLGFGSYPPEGTSFATAWAASIAIYASSANTSGYVRSLFLRNNRRMLTLPSDPRDF